MTDPYAIEERIAIRVADGMSERLAKELGDSERVSNTLQRRIASLAEKAASNPRYQQRVATPGKNYPPLKIGRKFDTASWAAGEK